jgi:hypothetical protein
MQMNKERKELKPEEVGRVDLWMLRCKRLSNSHVNKYILHSSLGTKVNSGHHLCLAGQERGECCEDTALGWAGPMDWRGGLWNGGSGECAVHVMGVR